MKCKHKWVDVPKEESRSYQDQICQKCGIKQMQGAMTMRAPGPEITNINIDNSVVITNSQLDSILKDLSKSLAVESRFMK